MEKSPKPQPKKTIEGPEAEIVHEEMERQAGSFFQRKINELMQSAAEESDKKRFVIDQIAASREKWFQDREEILETILAKIEALPYDTDAEFEADVARELTDTVVTYMSNSGISLEEAQRKFRIMMTEQDGYIPLDRNGVTNCSRYEDIAEIHITKGLTPGIWKEAMGKFAQIVQNDESIKTIKMKSWIVAEKLPFFRKLGFIANEITDEEELEKIRENLEGMEENRDKPIGEAYMTRKDFLKRYGHKLEKQNPDS
ncbi:MAG TPA: hypothetical protein VJH94_02240 [Candidatus Paceibacterota bacterium]